MGYKLTLKEISKISKHYETGFSSLTNTVCDL